MRRRNSHKYTQPFSGHLPGLYLCQPMVPKGHLQGNLWKFLGGTGTGGTLQAGRPSWCPVNSMKATKAQYDDKRQPEIESSILVHN